MLDENYGFHPHTMWATTTTENVKEIYKGEVKTLGLIRTYSTRHGNGPFVSEQSFKFNEPHNITSKWQGGFRFGALDIVATKYAMAVTGDVDSLVVTHTDRHYPYLCVGYNGIGKPFYKRNQLIPPTKGDLARQGQLTKALAKATPRLVTWDEVEEIGERLGKPIAITSFGARADQKKVCSL